MSYPQQNNSNMYQQQNNNMYQQQNYQQQNNLYQDPQHKMSQYNTNYNYGPQQQYQSETPAPSKTKQILLWISFVLLTLCTIWQLIVGCAYAAQGAGARGEWASIVTGGAWAVGGDYSWGGRRVHESYKKWQCVWVFIRAILTGLLAVSCFICARVPSYSKIEMNASGKLPGSCWLPFLAISSFIIGALFYLLPYICWEVVVDWHSDRAAIRVGIMLPLFISAASCFFSGGVAIACWVERSRAKREINENFNLYETEPLINGGNYTTNIVTPQPILYTQQQQPQPQPQQPAYYNQQHYNYV